MGVLQVLADAIAMTASDRAMDIVSAFLKPQVTKAVKFKVQINRSPWITSPLWVKKTVDGAILAGSTPKAGAKFAIPKGLPAEGKRSLAIENEPHTLEGFDGVIESGYGKGTKNLLFSGRVPVKIGNKTSIRLVEYHIHNADVAGLHYDLAVEGMAEGTKQFEINIPNGEYKGRFAFVTTPKGMVVTPMKDRGLVLPKPDYTLKSIEFLRDKVAPEVDQYVIERKVDGSLGNAVFGEERVYIRSHRETGQTYFDKLPGLEFLTNRSPFFTMRKIDPGPDLKGTVLKGELLHQDGVGRVSGILNSHPEKAHATQQKRGLVWFEGWDIVKLKGRDVSHLPASERRALLEQVIKQVRLYNKNWSTVDCYTGEDPVAFYNKVINDPRGLPYSEGIVVKRAEAAAGELWFKVKNRDFEDFIVREINPSRPGTKYAHSAAVMVVEDPITGGIGEVGSFAISDVQRQWIYDNRADLIGAVAKVSVMEKTANGVPRAGVFHAWHGDPRFGGLGAEMSLAMYADSLAGAEPQEASRMLYRLKSSAGWSRK